MLFLLAQLAQAHPAGIDGPALSVQTRLAGSRVQLMVSLELPDPPQAPEGLGGLAPDPEQVARAHREGWEARLARSLTVQVDGVAAPGQWVREAAQPSGEGVLYRLRYRFEVPPARMCVAATRGTLSDVAGARRPARPVRHVGASLIRRCAERL